MKNFLFFKSQNKSLRNPNIDFIRIAGMWAIIIHHLIFHGGAANKFRRYNKLIGLLNIFCMWHVSSFGIISGIVGIKTHKFSNLLYLWIQVLFYSLLFYIKYNLNDILTDKIFKFLFPVIHSVYWYFTAYFGIYPFLPFINAGLLNITQVEIKKSIYFIIGIFNIWASFHKDKFGQIRGYSSFSLLIFYLFGAYLGKFIFFKKLFIIYRFITCIVCLILFILISLICYYINIKGSFPNLDSRIKNLFRIGINSFPMLLQVISITIFISQIKFNNYISRIITFIGPLTFDIYLIHENPYIRSHYIRTSFNIKRKNNLNLFHTYLSIIKRGFFIFNIINQN